MDIQIRETGERKTLSIRNENGIEWTNDLIGNAGGLMDGQFVWSEEDDAYIADADTYDWWAQYIADTVQTDEEVTALADELGIDVVDIRERIEDHMAGVNDYDAHRGAAVTALAEIRDEHNERSAAAAILGRKGGQATSPAKTTAARANARKGGWPRGRPRKPTQAKQQETQTMTTDTLINLTNSANVTIGEPGPTSLSSIQAIVAEWRAEAAAYYPLEHGGEEIDPEDLPSIVVSGDEVRYYNSDRPGDYEVVGTVA